MTEGRRLYARSLIVRLRTDAGAGFAGVVAETEVDGSGANLAVDFPRNRCPRLAIGEQARLCFVGVPASPPMEARVETMVVSEDAYRMRCHFQIGRRFGVALSPVSYRRLAARVRPFPRAPIVALVGVHPSEEAVPAGAGLPEPLPATVRDVSATGVHLEVARGDEARLFAAWRLSLSLRFPGDECPIELVGQVCYRRCQGRGIHYGVDYDARATEDFDAKQARIFAYVSACETELLRRLLSSVTAAAS